jgi:tetratricopeptide (TPR) repeat protein
MPSLVQVLLAIASIAMLARIGLGAQPPEGTLKKTPAPQSTVTNKQPTDISISKYATDDFFGACYLRPSELIANDFFRTLSIDTIVPMPVSLDRLKKIGVSELIVFSGAAVNNTNHRWKDASRLELAAAASLPRSVEFDAFLRQWRQSTVPKHSQSEKKPALVRIGDQRCMRVPAGTFLNPQRVYGELQFTDHRGQRRDKGVNVGEMYEYRSYIEGATKANATFTLQNLNETDLIDGHLPLELRLAVFFTRRLEHEYGRGRIILRNPETDLRSEPIPFEAESYVNQELSIPRKLNAMDAKGETREVDLLKDLAANGKLEIILKGNDQATYFGFGQYDLNLKTSAAEYVFVSDREIVVAQSPATLKKMLRAKGKPSLLAKRLSQVENDLTIVANVRDQSQRNVLKEIINAIGDGESVSRMGDSVVALTATMNMNEADFANIKFDLTDRRSADRLERQLDRALRSLKQKAYDRIDEFVRGDDVNGAFLSLLFAVPMHFPRLDVPTAEAREQLQAIVDETLAGVKVESKNATLTVHVTEPKVFSRLPKSGQFALAWLEEKHARSLFSTKRFDRGDEMYRRVTERLPNFPELWFRRAHHLSYNMSVQFDGYEARYSWVRRGIESLLDGAAFSMDSVDPIWMAGNFIAKKIGRSDEHIQYRTLFSQDQQLHKRLAKYIDIDKARSPDNRVDNWLVARMMFEHCIGQHTKTGKRFSISPIFFFSQPAVTQAEYASSLDKAGHWDEAVEAWREAERMFIELGERSIKLETRDEFKLNDLQKRLTDFGPTDATVKLIQTGRKLAQYDYWLTRCKLERTDKVRSARKLSHEADQHFRKSEPSQSFELYQQSLQALAEQSEKQPKQMHLIAAAFRSISDGYQRVAESLGEQDDESLKPILQLIENSQPRSIFPLLDEQGIPKLD